jgi:hypothetical protein
MTPTRLLLAVAVTLALLASTFTRVAEVGLSAQPAGDGDRPLKTFFYGFPPRPATASTTAHGH